MQTRISVCNWTRINLHWCLQICFDMLSWYKHMQTFVWWLIEKNKNILVSKICLFTMWDQGRYACNQYILISGILVSRVLCSVTWDTGECFEYRYYWRALKKSKNCKHLSLVSQRKCKPNIHDLSVSISNCWHTNGLQYPSQLFVWYVFLLTDVERDRVENPYPMREATHGERKHEEKRGNIALYWSTWWWWTLAALI